MTASLMKSWSDARYSSAVKNCKVAGKVAADLLNWLVQQQLVGWSDLDRCCLKHKILTMTLWTIFSPPGTKSTLSALRWAVTRQATLADFATNFLTGGLSSFPGSRTDKRKRTKRHFTPGIILNNAKIWQRKLIFCEHCSGWQGSTQVVLYSTVWREKTA